jgi:FkbH-like protein
MNRVRLAGLPWLPPAPPDFKERCKRCGSDGVPAAVALRRLAGHALEDADLERLRRTVLAERQRHGGLIPGLRDSTLGLLGNGTTKLIAPALVATAVRYGIDLTTVEGEFDQALREATMADSAIARAAPHGIIVALDHRGLPGLGPGLSDDEEGDVAAALAHVAAICRGLRQSTGATLFVQNVPCPPCPLFGSQDARVRGTQRRRIERFNRDLDGLLTECSGILLDVDGLARTVGSEHWFDHSQWHAAKLPFAHDLVPLYADHALRLVAAVGGAARKCLVLDLDNTLWGGVVGDDGLHGLVLGQGDALGEAFVAVQQAAAWLRSRGVVLAVCSKNDADVARAAFAEHPDMVLRLDDIAVFQANWQDKATNLQAIARTLDIGTDALVLLDDNPAERELVRMTLPEVAVPELTADPADYPLLLLAAGYFESVSFTDEDRRRAGLYRANAVRAELAASATDMEAYLASLDMVVRLSPFDATGRSRIAQLTQRSNQFNLTTRRYDEAAVEAFERHPDAFTLQVRLADRCGDNGMISVVICTQSGTEWIIDTWLMSCRVLNRRVEEAVLDVLAATAIDRGITRLTGHYVPTERNGMVREHYPRLGFAPGPASAGVDVWHLVLAGYQPRRPPMTFILGDGIRDPDHSVPRSP